MIVKKINWLSVPAAEAEVEVCGGDAICIAFSCPCEVKVNDALLEPLHAFDARNMTLTDTTKEAILNLTPTGLGRKVFGRLVNLETQLFAVDEIMLVVDDALPGGLQSGEMVEFECARIDLW